MSEFFSFLKVFVGCSSLIFIVLLVLLALPQSKLRTIGLEITKYALAAGLFLLVPSPVDVLPDVIPALGWCDDLGYVVAGIAAIRSALGERKKRLLYEEIELKDLKDKAAQAGKEGA